MSLAFQQRVYELEQKVKDLEAKVFRSKRKNITLAQQILAMHELGMLDAIRSLNIGRNKTSKIIAQILNADYDNADYFLGELSKKVPNSGIKTKGNLKAVKQLFLENDLEEHEEKIQLTINALQDAYDREK